MLELTQEQMVAFRAAIENKTEETLVEFDNDLKRVVDRITTEGWTLPSDAGIFMIKHLGLRNKLLLLLQYCFYLLPVKLIF